MFRRAARRAAPTPALAGARTDLTVRAQVSIDRPAPEVFRFMDDPASMARLRDDIVSGVRMPGSGPGIGEVQVFLGRTPAGTTITALEVIEWTPGERALTRNLGHMPEGLIDILIETVVEPAGEASSVLTHTMTYVLATGQVAQPAGQMWVAENRQALEQINSRAKVALETENG